MRKCNHVLTLLAAAGLLCGAIGSSVAQEKKPNGKKPNGMPPAKAPMEFKVPLGDAKAAEETGGAAGVALDPNARPIPGLDYNYYHPAPGAGGMEQIPAQLYLCPSPYPPPYVGYTYITYPPFQPHEWLWIHRRAYIRYHPGGGATMTTIRWECE